MADRQNLILLTDSYKLTHWNMYPWDVQFVHSYLEARTGEGYQEFPFFGLQSILVDYLEGARLTNEDIQEAENLCYAHFGRSDVFNRDGWKRIVDVHGGRLPLLIKSVPEGTIVKRGQPVLTVENTDPHLPWLTNAVESLLMHVWAPSTVAAISYDLRKFFNQEVQKDSQFMLHDFGFRGCSSVESAAREGAAHLLSFMGTDTVPAMRLINRVYGQSENVAYSVAATEHSIMTQYGQEGENALIGDLISKHPNQILSIVADSYDYFAFAAKLVKWADSAKKNKTTIVIRPDSPSKEMNPTQMVMWTLAHTPFNCLWGDGLTPQEIKDIVRAVKADGQDPTRLVFGMGGGLLQKINRDTLRWALKCSAVKRLDRKVWEPIQKNPLDQTKASKAGRQDAELVPVFKDGLIVQKSTFGDIRGRVGLL